jgi:hypothetical protein
MTTQVVILRAARGFALSLARLKNATTAFFNRLLGASPTGDVAKARVFSTVVPAPSNRAAAAGLPMALHRQVDFEQGE